MSTGILNKSRVVYVAFLDKQEIPSSYRGRSLPVRCVGHDFYIGDDILTGAAKEYASFRIAQIDGTTAEREKRRDLPLKDFASETGADAWGLPESETR